MSVEDAWYKLAGAAVDIEASTRAPTSEARREYLRDQLKKSALDYSAEVRAVEAPDEQTVAELARIALEADRRYVEHQVKHPGVQYGTPSGTERVRLHNEASDAVARLRAKVYP